MKPSSPALVHRHFLDVVERGRVRAAREERALVARLRERPVRSSRLHPPPRERWREALDAEPL